MTPKTASKAVKIRVSANQKKVIADKYLRDDTSVEAWLRRVAHNIALAEILQHPKAAEWGVFKDVHFVIEHEKRDGANLAPMILFHEGLHDVGERNENHAKLVANLEDAARTRGEARKLVAAAEAKFFKLMADWSFLPNSPTLMNAGRELQQLSACYVLPVPDSMEGIMKSAAAQALIQKSGGGTGFSFCRVRPKGDQVKKTRGIASGALSFMKIFDTMTDVVKQGGTRRGANMGILPYWHPEILDFIEMKAQGGTMENFNISVAVDERFMEAVKDDLEIELINPRTKEVQGMVPARKIWEKMVDLAWKSGDPGMIVLDRINASGSNPTPALGQIESTNPCGEQPLLPWEPCNLGSLNLGSFVVGELTKGEVDYDALGAAVDDAVHLLDNVIDMNHYPLPEIERMAKGNRRIGLGVMGWAEMLVRLGIPFDGEQALDTADSVMGFINQRALEASEKLAASRGAFPNWRQSIYDPDSSHFRGDARSPRNCARTTIAPTGTIAIAAGLQGGGIEPFFAIAYTRYNAKALDALKAGQDPDPNDVFFEVNPLFKDIAKAYDYFGLGEERLWKKINDNHKAVRGIKEIPAEIQALFPTAHDVDVEFHVKVQARFQKHIDNGVSKTINLPNTASREDIDKAYRMAYDLGCKGITVYRDGSKAQQVLNLDSKPSTMKKKNRRAEPMHGVSSNYYQIKTGYGPLHIHINYDETGPYQVFTNIPPLGTEISGLTSLIGILLSKYLEEGGDPVKVLKHLNAVKGDRPFGFGENRVNSIPHAISIAIRKHLKKTGYIAHSDDGDDTKLELWEQMRAEYCPKCYSSNIAHESGCSGPTCHDCGHSECS